MKKIINFDNFLVFTSTAILIASLLYLIEGDVFLSGETNNDRKLNIIAQLTKTNQDVRIKEKNKFIWSNAHQKIHIENKTMLFTGEGSTADITFNNHEKLNIAANSLVIIEKNSNKITLNMKYGTFSGDIKKNTKLIIVSNGIKKEIISTQNKSKLTIQVIPNDKTKITVIQGEINLKSTNLKPTNKEDKIITRVLAKNNFIEIDTEKEVVKKIEEEEITLEDLIDIKTIIAEVKLPPTKPTKKIKSSRKISSIEPTIPPKTPKIIKKKNLYSALGIFPIFGYSSLKGQNSSEQQTFATSNLNKGIYVDWIQKWSQKNNLSLWFESQKRSYNVSSNKTIQSNSLSQNKFGLSGEHQFSTFIGLAMGVGYGTKHFLSSQTSTIMKIDKLQGGFFTLKPNLRLLSLKDFSSTISLPVYYHLGASGPNFKSRGGTRYGIGIKLQQNLKWGEIVGDCNYLNGNDSFNTTKINEQEIEIRLGIRFYLGN